MKTELSRNKRLFDMTGEELALVIQEALNKESTPKTPEINNDCHNTPRLVTGIKAAAQVLGVSQSTVARWKESGEIDDCIYQNGKTVIFDIHRILEWLRLSNRKEKYNIKK